MKTICFRLITFIFLAAGLSFVSDANLRIDEGKIFVVGRIRLASEPATALLPTQTVVAIGVAEGDNSVSGKKLFKINEILTVKPDSDGYFLLKNYPADAVYLFLGVQTDPELPLKVSRISAAEIQQSTGRVLSLGAHIISAQESPGTGKMADELSPERAMHHFVAKNNLTRFAHHFCNRAGLYGDGNLVVTYPAGQFELQDVENAVWKDIAL